MTSDPRVCACGRRKERTKRRCWGCQRGTSKRIVHTACSKCGGTPLVTGRTLCRPCVTAEHAMYPSAQRRKAAPRTKVTSTTSALPKMYLDSRVTANGSWWATAPRHGFTDRAWREQPRLSQSKFSRIATLTLDLADLRKRRPHPQRAYEGEAA